MRRVAAPFVGGASSGSLLLEVVFATVLVGLLLVPLAGAFTSAIGQVRGVREGLSAPSTTPVKVAKDCWEWGPRVLAAWWEPGPVLHAKVSRDGSVGSGDGEDTLGLWAGGWLLAREPLVPDTGPYEWVSDLQFGPGLWAGREGAELLLRLRTAAGPWGPPWRTVVPAPDGSDPTPVAAAPDPAPHVSVVVHRPGAGSTALQVSWSSGIVESLPFDRLFALSPLVDGWAGTELDDRDQWWPMEADRSVDVYY